MELSLCGINCGECTLKECCAGCAKTNGHPFGGKCIIASCPCKNNCDICSANTKDSRCQLKADMISKIKLLGIKELSEISDLYSLKGSFVNIEYTLPNGQKIKFWNDNEVYLGIQVEITGSDRCYGVITDTKNLLVCEYGKNGENPVIIVYKTV